MNGNSNAVAALTSGANPNWERVRLEWQSGSHHQMPHEVVGDDVHEQLACCHTNPQVRGDILEPYLPEVFSTLSETSFLRFRQLIQTLLNLSRQCIQKVVLVLLRQ